MEHQKALIAALRTIKFFSHLEGGSLQKVLEKFQMSGILLGYSITQEDSIVTLSDGEHSITCPINAPFLEN